jgi:hypothetical protein
MPYIIEKAPSGSGFLVKNKETGRALEKQGIPEERAERQIRAVLMKEKEKPYPLNKIKTLK